MTPPEDPEYREDLLARDGTLLRRWDNGAQGVPVVVSNGLGASPTAWPFLHGADCAFTVARQHGWQDPRQRKEVKSNGAALENAADVENATDPTTEWPDIDPALTESARRDIPVFPVFLFPPAWRKWTVATAEGAGAPVDYVAMGLLGNVAGVTGCGVFVEVTASWREPVVVWPAAVGAPSMGKTPALAATRRLIDAVESAARDKDAERQREHETKAEAAKLAEEKWREEVAEAAEADKPPPTKPAAADRIEPFIPTQMVIEDATIESVVDVVRGNPRGVVLWRDEITGWLKNLGRYNAGSDRALLAGEVAGKRCHRQPEEPADRPHSAAWSVDRGRHPAGPPRRDLRRRRRRDGLTVLVRVARATAIQAAPGAAGRV